jgi:hypothetical protein
LENHEICCFHPNALEISIRSMKFIQ